jgi:hypothetical protein
MKRLASIRLMLSIALLVLVGAPLGARAAVSHVATAPDALEAVTTPHVHHHRHQRTHHAAKAETADMRATGSARPEHRHGGSTSHHRATVPSYGQSQPTHRHPRADGRGLAAVQEVTTTDGRDAAMLRSRSPRATLVNERRVGSGRAPPRGAPTDDSEIPHAPPRLRIPAPSPAPQFDPAPPAIAQSLRARPAAPPSAPHRRPAPVARHLRSFPPASSSSLRPDFRPDGSLAAYPVVPERSVPDRLPVHRTEGTVTGSLRPS